jgi:hypothetical protein
MAGLAKAKSNCVAFARTANYLFGWKEFVNRERAVLPH